MSEQQRQDRRLRVSVTAAASRLARLGDLPVIVMLAWVGWLAVPWSFSGLAQARAAAAAAAGHDRPVEFVRPAHSAAPMARLDVVARERARIAGEVHDAAGHGLATIALQAGVALLMFDERPEQARESLEAIRDTSVRALTQLRAALDLIDPGGAPTGEDLPQLLDGVRAAGLPVDVEPAQPAVPAHLQGTVYRVVRESLTNVLRHAGPTRALVRVANDPCEFVLEVADRGRGSTGGLPYAMVGAIDAKADVGGGAGEGRGLAGMRARVTAAGGSLTAGPREGGGFQVVARFPQEST